MTPILNSIQSKSVVCLALCLSLSSFAAMAGDWPQWRGTNRDATINDSSLPIELPAGQLPRQWSAAVGPGYSGPTIANGRVYLTDRQGESPNAVERVLCFDAESGKPLWQHQDPVQYAIGYEASGPRAAVTIDNGQAFAVGAMGRMNCFDAATGSLQWTRDLQEDFKIDMPIWGITAAPLIYDNLVIQMTSGKAGACVVALDRSSGVERWRSLDERGGYSAPILVRQGDQDVVVCWTGDSVSGLDPKNGAVFWSIEMKPRNMPIGVPTPVIQDDLLFVSSFYDGSLLIRLDQQKPAAATVWRRIGVDERNTDALHAMISNPIIKGDCIYGADSYGEFRCLDLMTGDRIWENLDVVPKARWATVHIIRNGNNEIIQNDRGELLMTTLKRSGIDIHSRSQLISPTTQQLKRRDGVVWSHPAIANGKIYARNDDELICVPLR
ncbi:PQQ-like beta-propeller repeat protein [Stieleria sp. JC731]|uniref:outer membrane protein assembly factor BamB family protein n=1 Tax=Pirellulaceae TaxID=2691357 RepID=UPI001E493866|nr:PQQ-binding-like beta-propeller repeat protein [Stieleria sp. JC731]MCC9599373.1 PQQ-like beta-propeller repeat protein [Stieleria sp. JC731]